MSLSLRSALVLAALTTTAALAPAQEISWNRRISDVRIVHPPGTPPGTWRVQASVETFVASGTAGPIDLSLEARVLLNGVEIGVLPGPLSIQDGPSCSNQPNCSAGQQCNGMNNGAGNIPGICIHYASPLTGAPLCGCLTQGGVWDFGPYSDLRTTDTITVTLTPTSLSFVEPYTGDDSYSVPVPLNPVGVSLCSADSTSPVPCPCANSGASGHGCANSQNPDGALLEAFGWTFPDPGTTNDSVVLHGSGMPATSTAIYLKGDASQPPITFGDGLLCTGGSLIRLRTKINVGGASQFPEPGDPSLSVRGATPPGSGVSGWYQIYYRNAASAFCPPATYNISNGMRIDW